MKVSSPFPGMDPYLEGHIWPDVHHGLASAIQELLAPAISPKYVARVETYTDEDTKPESEVGITYPDVAILKRTGAEEQLLAHAGTAVMTEPDTYVTTTVTVRIPAVQIRDVAKNQLITCIDILSPVNKRSPGWQPYHEKRNDLHNSGVHLLEIDLLRRGRRHLWNVGKPEPHYVFTLWRKGTMKVALLDKFFAKPASSPASPAQKPRPRCAASAKTSA